MAKQKKTPLPHVLMLQLTEHELNLLRAAMNHSIAAIAGEVVIGVMTIMTFEEALYAMGQDRALMLVEKMRKLAESVRE